MRSWIRSASSILAIAGGVLFLVLPVAYLNGTVSIGYQIVLPHSCFGFYSLSDCLRYNPVYIISMPAAMAAFWAYLGAIGIILGALALKLSLRPRVGVALGHVLSLGSMTLLLWTLTRQILKSFVTKPASFLVFPELSVVAMAGATVLFGYELSRRRRDINEAFLSYSFLWRLRLEINPVLRLPVAAAEFALHKLHMTLTILRKNKNTTTTNLLTPTSDLSLTQRPVLKTASLGRMQAELSREARIAVLPQAQSRALQIRYSLGYARVVTVLRPISSTTSSDDN